VSLERGPLSLVSTTEELLDRNVAAPVKKIREYGRRDPSRWPRGTLYWQKLAITSPTSCGRSVGIVRSRTQAMEFKFKFFFKHTFLSLRISSSLQYNWSTLTRTRALHFWLDLKQFFQGSYHEGWQFQSQFHQYQFFNCPGFFNFSTCYGPRLRP
jgi:hypothetical protein